MNKTDDIPIYSASIFYYDFDYKEETSMLVQQILESYCFFPPERINAGKLTNESYQLYTEMDKDILVKAYSESDVLSISMGSEDSIVTKDFWKVNWNLTFHKWSERKNNSSFKPWNVLTLLSSHTRLNDSVNYNNFFNCFFRLIEALSPFYASIDDVKNGIKLRHKKPFRPTELQPIYWGNYWGADYLNIVDSDAIITIPNLIKKPIGNGIYFQLNESLLYYSDRSAKWMRFQIRRRM